MKNVILLLILFLGYSCNSVESEKSTLFEQKGDVFLNKRNFSSAIIAFTEAKQFNSEKNKKAELNYKIAFSFYSQNQIDSAKHYALKSLQEIDKNSYTYSFNSSFYFILNGDFTQAMHFQNKAFLADSSKSEINYFLSLMCSGAFSDFDVNQEKALHFAKNAFNLSNNSFTKEQLAIVSFQLEDFKLAEKLFGELYFDFPSNKLFEFNQGQCLYFLGKEEKGFQLMKDAAERDDNCRELFNELIEK